MKSYVEWPTLLKISSFIKPIYSDLMHWDSHGASRYHRTRQVSELDTGPLTHRELAHTSEFRGKGRSSETEDTVRTF